mgnify:CR=1 FL=1|jgi:hypothetical protein
MSDKPVMQQKLINFSKWIASLITQHADPESDEAKEFVVTLTEYFEDNAAYEDMMFAKIPQLCTAPQTQTKIITLRNLKKPEERKEAIDNCMQKLKLAKAVIDAILTLPPEVLDETVHKFSLYINLFTDMYLQNQ